MQWLVVVLVCFNLWYPTISSEILSGVTSDQTLPIQFLEKNNNSPRRLRINRNLHILSATVQAFDKDTRELQNSKPFIEFVEIDSHHEQGTIRTNMYNTTTTGINQVYDNLNEPRVIFPTLFYSFFSRWTLFLAICMIPTIRVFVRFYVSYFYEWVWEITDRGEIRRKLRRRRRLSTRGRRRRESPNRDTGITTNITAREEQTRSFLPNIRLRYRNREPTSPSDAARQTHQHRLQPLLDQLNTQRVDHGENPLSLDTFLFLLRRRDGDFHSNDYDALWDFQEESTNQIGNGGCSNTWSHLGLTNEEIERFPKRILQEKDIEFLIKRGEDIESRGLHSESAIDDDKENRACVICLDDFQLGDLVRTISCFHTFHCDCIDPWLRQKSTCPVCKLYATA